MSETILNIYLIIDKNFVTAFKAKSYQADGSDEEKIIFLKSCAVNDYQSAEIFKSPIDKKNQFMPYKRFAKLERQGMQFQLFEEIFQKFEVPENPLICVTPVVDGKILG
ncbi:MAG: hypothetical protein HYS25_02290 [Ignavibacteriales bacterium]|nr:hypothetical protein [Ignavibacteriales bacterium]